MTEVHDCLHVATPSTVTFMNADWLMRRAVTYSIYLLVHWSVFLWVFTLITRSLIYLILILLASFKVSIGVKELFVYLVSVCLHVA